MVVGLFLDAAELELAAADDDDVPAPPVLPLLPKKWVDLGFSLVGIVCHGAACKNKNHLERWLAPSPKQYYGIVTLIKENDERTDRQQLLIGFTGKEFCCSLKNKTKQKASMLEFEKTTKN